MKYIYFNELGITKTEKYWIDKSVGHDHIRKSSLVICDGENGFMGMTFETDAELQKFKKEVREL